MTFCETIIAYDATINNETDSLEVMAGSAPLTTRVGRGRPKITHAMALASTDDITRVYIVPQGMNDNNGIPISCVNVYGATGALSLAESRLDTPVELPENCALTIYATSETAANTVVVVWLVLEYPSTGKFIPIRAGPVVRRAWEHGAALVSMTEADSTAITSLLPGQRYQLSGIDGVAVNGATAGIVGPAFMRVKNVEMDGAIYWIPLINGGSFLAAGQGSKKCSLAEAGMKFPLIAGGTPLYTAGLGYTAEQPQGELKLVADKIF